MFRNYFITAYRNILRHKVFSFINISGLSLGITACLLIGLFVYDEYRFDKFIPGGDRVYRVYYEITGDEGTDYIGTTPAMFATTLEQNFPEVENTLRVMELRSKLLFEKGNKKMYEEKGVFADSTFFELFPLSFTHGSAAGALVEPASIVISEDMAERFFGKENPVGEVIQMNKFPFKVTGVYQNNPRFHLSINFILPMAAGVPKEQLQNWTTYAYNSYARLEEGANVNDLETKFQNYTAPFLKGDGPVFLPRFQPLREIHLQSFDFKHDMAQKGNITYVRALSIIAIFILLIACFNFVNLATAKSLQRAKEVGVRKAIGASRKQLVLQFLGETILLTSISVIFSAALTSLLLPVLNEFTGKQMTFNVFSDPSLAVLLLIMTLIVGILAGFYPALILSGFQPIKVLKGGSVSEVSPGRIPWLRQGLVVAQFSISVLLIISAIIVITQVNFLHNKDLGFNKKEIMFFPMRGENMQTNYETFKNELLKSPHVSSVSIGYGFPGDMFGDGFVTAPVKGEQKKIKATQLMVDTDYIKTLGIQLVAGRDFSKEIKTDKDEAYIINETTVRELGFETPEQALGQTLMWNTWRDPDLVKKGQVVGVVKDFHYKSLYDKVEPTVLQIYPEAYSKVAVKMETADVANTIVHVKNVWDKFSPDYPIEYNFLDENFDQMYKAEDKLKSLLWIFTGITIFVSCLGLFGLAAYAAERRRKEIGIRKILGASVRGIVLLLSKDFLKMVVIALLIASPVAWYFMHQWLQDFAYRIDIGWWVFGVAGAAVIIVALLTVCFQAIKAATANPVNNLRIE
ncbi:ABC transporter permease [Pontibacter toksunensis]|uniref:ABC transporter permease n=1 Tax=Pontibacter toksunensis TaxID=1332631 RepID=A0ABW6BYA5_9BACT